MVTRNLIVSDISGEPDATTVRLGLDSELRDVDLTEAERSDLDAMLRPYLAAGRRSESAAPRSNRSVPESTFAERSAIRRWGHEHGYELADRGIIPRAVYDAYQQAHGSEVDGG
jgi:hypothetical protein